MHLVQEKGGGWRIIGDFRQLNRQTISDRYSIPLLSDFVGDMEGSTVFSSLDLYKGYHQVEIAPEDQCKMSIITPLGNFAFRRLPMGISCAANSFQRFMHEVLQGIPNVFCFIDDLLIRAVTSSFRAPLQTSLMGPHFLVQNVQLGYFLQYRDHCVSLGVFDDSVL